MLNFDVNFYYDDQLHEVVKNFENVNRRIHALKQKLTEEDDGIAKVPILGELGFLLRVTGDL